VGVNSVEIIWLEKLPGVVVTHDGVAPSLISPCNINDLRQTAIGNVSVLPGVVGLALAVGGTDNLIPEVTLMLQVPLWSSKLIC
jgi:hypothetical protein